MRDADVTHASNVRPRCDGTIHSNGEGFAEAWEKTSTERDTQCEITPIISSKLFILRRIVKSQVAERKKSSKEEILLRVRRGRNAPGRGRNDVSFQDAQKNLQCHLTNSLSICLVYCHHLAPILQAAQSSMALIRPQHNTGLHFCGSENRTGTLLSSFECVHIIQCLPKFHFQKVQKINT